MGPKKKVAMAAWQKVEKAFLGGLFCSGTIIHLSLPTSVPTIPFGHFLEILDEQKCSITMVNGQYARVTTKDGGLLLPFANYHVMLGRSMDETVRFAHRMADKVCGEEGFDMQFEQRCVRMQFEQRSPIDEAFANGRSLASGTWLGLNQFIAEKYMLSR